MTISPDSVGLDAAPVKKTRAEKLEGLAFTFCKIATVALFAGRYTLPLAALLSAGLFVTAHVKGQRESRCILRYPLLIAGFWIVVFCVWLVFFLQPQWSKVLPFRWFTFS